MDGLIAGAMIGLGAIGITLTYSILRFANFAHGELISWGAYLALAVSGVLGYLSSNLTAAIGPFSFGWSLPLAAMLAIVADRRAGAGERCPAVRPPARQGRLDHHHGDGELRRGADPAQPARVHLHHQAGLLHQRAADRDAAGRRHAGDAGPAADARPLRRPGGRDPSAADAHRHRPLDARGQREPAALRHRRHRRAQGHPHGLAARRRPRLRRRHHGRPAGADPPAHGARPAAAAVRRGDPGRHRQRAGRDAGGPDRRAQRIPGRAVHRRGMARRRRLRHPGRRAADPPEGPVREGRHERGADRLRRVLPHHRADLRHHVPRPQRAVGPDRTVQCRRRRLRRDRRLCLRHPDHAGLAGPPGRLRLADRDRLARRHGWRRR